MLKSLSKTLMQTSVIINPQKLVQWSSNGTGLSTDSSPQKERRSCNEWQSARKCWPNLTNRSTSV